MQWPIPLTETSIHLSSSAQQTRELGLALGQRLPRGTVLALQGALGTGKPTLVKGTAEALRVQDAVTSPSFTLASEYEGSRPEGPLRLYHVDLYRLADARELAGIGLEDMLAEAEQAGGLVAIEWAERAALPLEDEAYRARTVWVLCALRPDGTREIRLRAGGVAAA